MAREGFNRWPPRDSAPELWTHDLRYLFSRLKIDTFEFDPKSPVAPKIKTVVEWRREHGYSVRGMPIRQSQSMFEAAFGTEGVCEWLAKRFRLNI